jgi:hypothetical protein
MFRETTYRGIATRSPEWSAKKFNSIFAGKEAFTADNGKGYRTGQVLGKSLKAHRVIWAIAHGQWPAEEIDHVNGVRSDNRLVNLREATSSENGWNTSSYSNNTSGFKGVSWDRKNHKWVANIRHLGKQWRIGSFSSALEAHKAYQAEALSLRREFTRSP